MRKVLQWASQRFVILGNENHSCWNCQYSEHFYPKALNITWQTQNGRAYRRSEHRLEQNCLQELNRSMAMNSGNTKTSTLTEAVHFLLARFSSSNSCTLLYAQSISVSASILSSMHSKVEKIQTSDNVLQKDLSHSSPSKTTKSKDIRHTII